jgi:general secretion pathway protein B
MSYILDALKKADAEREQGTIPGLLSQPKAPAPGDDDDEPKARIQPVVWVGAGVAICLIGVLSWQLLTREAPAPGVASAPAVAPVEAVPQEAPPVQQAMAPPPAPLVQQDAAAVPPPVPAPALAPAPPAQRSAPAPLAAATPSQTTRTQAQPTPPSATPNITPNSAPTNPAPTPPSGQVGGPRVPSLSELPEHLRREIPQLTIGGAMYSETPAQRMLIINSQVFREGDQPYQGLVLEEIRLKSAVFQYRGQRYSVNY